MRNHMPPDGQFDVFLEKAKVAFRKGRQRKNERATAERQAAQSYNSLNLIFTFVFKDRFITALN